MRFVKLITDSKQRLLNCPDLKQGVADFLKIQEHEQG